MRRHPWSTAADVAELLGADPAATNLDLLTLVSHGWLVRNRHPETGANRYALRADAHVIIVGHELAGTRPSAPCRTPEPETWATGEGAPGYCRCGHLLQAHDRDALADALSAMAEATGLPIASLALERVNHRAAVDLFRAIARDQVGA